MREDVGRTTLLSRKPLCLGFGCSLIEGHLKEDQVCRLFLVFLKLDILGFVFSLLVDFPVGEMKASACCFSVQE